jgi:hypothetical protein
LQRIDDTQLDLIDIEQNFSQKFYVAYLNNVRTLILLFNNLVYKENFIMLPGDEVIEKKHKNIKHLIAMEQNEDLSRRETRSFPGLGANVFKIDFAKLFPAAYGGSADEHSGPVVEKELPLVQNEINTDLTVKNTPYHKHVVKARNDAYV